MSSTESSFRNAAAPETPPTSDPEFRGLRQSPDDQLIDRVCPICGTAGTPNDVLVRAPVRAELLPAGQRDQYWRGFRSRPCFFDYARCATCGLLYCPTYFSQSSLDRLYSSMPDNTAGADANALSATQESYIDFMSRHGEIAGTYLEIGPDIGLSTRAACARGKLQRAILVEPNADVHAELRAAVGEVPTEIFDSVHQLSADDRADNVVLIHVLDHLIDPLAQLRNLHDHTAKGGVLLAVVHNEASLLRRGLGVRWPPFCLQHPQLFNPSTLGKLFSEAGFTVVDSSPTYNIWPLRHLVKIGAALLGISGTWVEHVPETRLRLKLGNIMMVARA